MAPNALSNTLGIFRAAMTSKAPFSQDVVLTAGAARHSLPEQLDAAGLEGVIVVTAGPGLANELRKKASSTLQITSLTGMARKAFEFHHPNALRLPVTDPGWLWKLAPEQAQRSDIIRAMNRWLVAWSQSADPRPATRNRPLSIEPSNPLFNHPEWMDDIVNALYGQPSPDMHLCDALVLRWWLNTEAGDFCQGVPGVVLADADNVPLAAKPLLDALECPLLRCYSPLLRTLRHWPSRPSPEAPVIREGHTLSDRAIDLLKMAQQSEGWPQEALPAPGGTALSIYREPMVDILDEEKVSHAVIARDSISLLELAGQYLRDGWKVHMPGHRDCHELEMFCDMLRIYAGLPVKLRPSTHINLRQPMEREVLEKRLAANHYGMTLERLLRYMAKGRPSTRLSGLQGLRVNPLAGKSHGPLHRHGVVVLGTALSLGDTQYEYVVIDRSLAPAEVMMDWAIRPRNADDCHQALQRAISMATRGLILPQILEDILREGVESGEPWAFPLDRHLDAVDTGLTVVASPNVPDTIPSLKADGHSPMAVEARAKLAAIRSKLPQPS